MRIGIVGSGNVGGGLTRRLSALGHEVAVSNSRGPGSLDDLATESGATAATIEDAVRDADLVIVAVPLKAVPDLPCEAFAEKVVVDACNYYPGRDGEIAQIEGGLPSSTWVAQYLGGATVVKAFNNIQAGHLESHGRPQGDPDRIALPIASDDGAAKQRISDVVEQLGFDPIDAGTLAESWRQQPGTPVYGTDLDAAGLREGLATAER
jgi:8-hydroxy-5-deazaflavin:NADPH oxidoreductase